MPAAQRPPVNVVRFAFQTMVGIGTLLALLGVAVPVVWIRRRRLPDSRWFYRAVVLAGPLSVVALIAGWVVDRGRPPAVGRLPRDADPAAVTGASGIPVGYGVLAASYVASRAGWPGCCGAWPGRRSSCPEPEPTVGRDPEPA